MSRIELPISSSKSWDSQQMDSTSQHRATSSIPLRPTRLDTTSLRSRARHTYTPSRPARPDFEISFDELEGLSAFAKRALYPSQLDPAYTLSPPARSIKPQRNLPSDAAPTQPLPPIPVPTQQDLEDPVEKEFPFIEIFSPRVGQGLDIDGIKARQARKDSDAFIAEPNRSISPTLSSHAPATPMGTTEPPISPMLVPLTPILARIWPLFGSRWRPTTASPLSNPAIVTPHDPSTALTSPASLYPAPSPTADQLASLVLDATFSPAPFCNPSPALQAFASPGLNSSPESATTQYVPDAIPKITIATPRFSPTSAAAPSPQSYITKATINAPWISRANGCNHVKFIPGMRMKALAFGRFGKLVYRLYPLYVFFPVVAQLFLDFNVLLILILLGINPTRPSSLPSQYFPRFRSLAIIVPVVHYTTTFWILVGAYIIFSLSWIIGVCVWRDLRGWRKDWDSGSGEIEAIYQKATSFNYTCMQSFGHFSFLYRVQLARGNRASEDILQEAFRWNVQNWPSTLLSATRAAISFFVLLGYATTAYGACTDATGVRNSIYFLSSGLLSNYGSAILMTTCCFAAYQIIVLLGSYLGILILGISSPARYSCSTGLTPSNPFDSDLKQLEEANASPRTFESNIKPINNADVWRLALRERIKSAWEVATIMDKSRGILAERSTTTVILGQRSASPNDFAAEGMDARGRSRKQRGKPLPREQPHLHRGRKEENGTGVSASAMVGDEGRSSGGGRRWRGMAPYILSPTMGTYNQPATSPAPFEPIKVTVAETPTIDYFAPQPVTTQQSIRSSTSQYALQAPEGRPGAESRAPDRLESRFSNWTADGTHLSLHLAGSSSSLSILSSPSLSLISHFPTSPMLPLPSPPILEALLVDTAETLSLVDYGLNISNCLVDFSNPFATLRANPLNPDRAIIDGPRRMSSASISTVRRAPIQRRQTLLEEVQRLSTEKESKRRELLRRREDRSSLPSGDIECNFKLKEGGGSHVLGQDWFRAI